MLIKIITFQEEGVKIKCEKWGWICGIAEVRGY